MKAGDTQSQVLVDGLTRTQIVQYAGASGDYNPLHTDEAYATHVAGYPSVFAHGMLVMGMTGRVLTDWFGADALTGFEARFVAQVWPGDTLTARVTIEALDGTVASVSIVTANQRGEVVLKGSATAHTP